MGQPLRDERGTVLIIELVVLAVVLAAAVYATYQYTSRKNAVSQLQTPRPQLAAKATPSSSKAPKIASPSPTPTLTDQELITGVIKATISSQGTTPPHGTQIILRELQGDYARVDIEVAQSSGYFYLVKKSQGAWGIAYTGQNIESGQETQLGFPPNFGNGPFVSTVLYTY